MITKQERMLRIVALTLLGSAAIVPALLSRRLLNAKAVVADADRLRASWNPSALLGAGAGSGNDSSSELKHSDNGAESGVAHKTGPANPDGNANSESSDSLRESDLRALEKALVPLPTGQSESFAISHPVRFFSKNGSKQANVTNHSPESSFKDNNSPDNNSGNPDTGTGGPNPGAAASRPEGAVTGNPVEKTPESVTSSAPSNVAQGPESAPATADGNNGGNTPSGGILPPVADTPNVTEDGVVIYWHDHPATPVGSILKSQVFRWSERESPTPIFVTSSYEVGSAVAPDGKPVPRSHEYRDRTACTGVRYSYAILSIQLDRLEGVEVRRSVLGERIQVDVPIRYQFEPVGFVVNGNIQYESALLPAKGAAGGKVAIRLAITDLREAVPAPKFVDIADFTEINASNADAGQAIGRETGWIVVKIEREEREENVEITVPLFAADGSRKIENGAAASENRVVRQKRSTPVVTLRDRCGSERTVRTPRASSPNPATAKPASSK